MKYTLLFTILMLTGTETLFSQRWRYPVMEVFPARIEPLEQNYPLPLPSRLFKKQYINRSIENAAVRYAVQNLEKEQYDREIETAIKTILDYAEDSRIQRLIEHLRKYSYDMGKKEQAIETLENKIIKDSIAFYGEGQAAGDDDDRDKDLQTLVNYVRNDSNYIWIRNAGRDSVLLNVSSVTNHSARFWINNGRSEYHRFWMTNKLGDTIATWIQTLPQDNMICVHIDNDAFQATRIKPKRVNDADEILDTQSKDYFKIQQIDNKDIRRRYWTYYSEVEMAMSQGMLANWASGGENSISFLSNIRYFLNYNKNKTSWENWVHYQFGFLKSGDEAIRKNQDRFELNTKLGVKAFKHWYYTAQFNALTQLFNSYDYPKDKDPKLVANLLSPAYFTISLGLDYKPNANFSLIISPVAVKWNFVRDTAKISASRYGVKEGRSLRKGGASIDLRSNIYNLFKVMDLKNEVRLFTSYDEKDKNKDKPGIFTANWKLTLSFKINYFMNATIYTETVYDENFSKKLQFKENLNLGVKFRF